MKSLMRLLLVCCGITAIMLTTLPEITHAETSVDALRSLKKLQTKCDSGLRYKEYNEAFSDTKFSVEMYLMGKRAPENAGLDTMIGKILDDYATINELWQYKIENYPIGYIMHDDAMYRGLLDRYPEADKPSEMGGVLDSAYNYKLCEEEKAFRKRIGGSSKELPGYCDENAPRKLAISSMIKFLMGDASLKLRGAMSDAVDSGAR